jgi:hypothetical protein
MTQNRIVHEAIQHPTEVFVKWDITFIRDFFPEIRDAVDAAFAVDPCEGMTSQEQADWILGIDVQS